MEHIKLVFVILPIIFKDCFLTFWKPCLLKLGVYKFPSLPISSGQRCYWKSNQVQCAKEIYFWNQNIFLLLKSLYQPLVPLNYSNQNCRSYLHSSTSLISLIQLIKICKNELISLLYLDYFQISAKKT